VDNAFVGAGLMGGLPGFILFLCIFVYGYRTIGAARKAAEESAKDARVTDVSAGTSWPHLDPADDARRDARLIWAIGAALFANTTAFFGIVYFDQSIIAWYALLVMIQVTTTFYVKAEPLDAEQELTTAETGETFPEPAWKRG